MHKIFEDVSVTGIIMPGHLYIIEECSNRGFPADLIDYLYLISEEKHIMRAMDMEFKIICEDEYELVKFLGIRKRNQNCHEFKVLCCSIKEKKKITKSMYLHRIESFEERLIRTNKIFQWAG